MKACLVLVVLCCVVVLAAPPVPAKRHVVNLDLPPIQRWTSIVTTYKNQYGPLIAWLDKTIPPAVQKLIDPIFENFDQYIPAPFGDEIRGVAQVLQTVGIDMGKVVLLNLIYDLTAPGFHISRENDNGLGVLACTSIVAQAQNGQILHARNLDYSIDGLKNITIQVDFQRNGTTIFSGTHFAGYVGILSGMRAGGWSVTVDERDRDGPGTVIDNILHLFKGGHSLGFFLRSALETNKTFDEAPNAATSVHLLAPVYLIMAGTKTNEAAVITRDREKPDDVWRLSLPTVWNLVETNYDHWKPSGDTRAATAIKGMATMSPANVTLDGMFAVISTPPVLNRGTAYSTKMNPATGFYETWIRFDD